jgi:hypothetical protein
MKLRHLLTILTLAVLIPIFCAIHHRAWDAATTFATIFVGLLAADVVLWQGYLVKRQLTFSTYLELDKEWNSDDMIKARQNVHVPKSDQWDHSRLEAVLEFFEKLASLFRISGEMPFIYESTLGWYAAQYFLFARTHGQVEYLRKLWQENLYTDLESFYNFYVRREAGRGAKAQQIWEGKRLSTEDKFWEQERKD